MNVVILGSGGHAKVVADIVQRAGVDRIVGIVDSHLTRGSQWRGYEVLGSDDELPRLAAEHNIEGALIAVGDNTLRAKIAGAVISLLPALKFPNAIHPAATLAPDIRIGMGNVVMAGAVVNSDTTIGDFCILNTLCSVDHDSTLGNYVSFAPHACAGGSVMVGDYCAIGLGANIIHRITIGEQTIVGAGSTVVRDLPSHVVAYGSPARVIRSRQPGERYL